MNWKGALTEGLGTFLLVLTVLATRNHPAVVGGIVALILFLTENAAHINPATTVVRILDGTVSLAEGAAFIVIQIAAAVGAVMSFRMAV